MKMGRFVGCPGHCRLVDGILLIIFTTVFSGIQHVANADWSSPSTSSFPLHRSRCNPREPTSIYTREPWVHAGKRSTITLHCQICFQRGKGIDSSHHGRIWWRKDGELLPRQSARLRQMAPTGAQSRRGRYSLRIRNVRDSDFGVYECGTNVTGGKQIRQKIHLSGAPYPARFAPPVVTADGVYDLSWRVNCSTPVISYELEFRELPHGNWLSLNVPGDANGDPRLLMGQLEDGGGFGEGGGGSAASRHHGGVVEHRQSYRLSGLPDEVNYECRVRSRNLYGMSGYSDVICFPDPEACSDSIAAAGQTDMWYNHHQSRMPREKYNEHHQNDGAATTEDYGGGGGGGQRGHRKKGYGAAAASASSEPLAKKKNKGFAAFSSAPRVSFLPSSSSSAIIVLIAAAATWLVRPQ